MEFQDLRAFAHTARSQSFSRAAAQLRIAQSAVSRRVQRLEQELGVRLIERYGRGIRLTEFGAVLLERVDHVLESVRQIEADLLATLREPTGRIRVAFPPTLGNLLAPGLIETFTGKYPGVSLYIKETPAPSMQDLMARGVIDLAVQYDPEESAHVSITRLMTEPLFLIDSADLPHAKAVMKKGNKVALRDIFRLPLILPGMESGIRLLLEKRAANFNLTLKIAVEADGMGIVKQIVEKGMGCTVFNYATVQQEVAQGRLQVVPIVGPSLSWKLSLVSRREQLASRALADLKTMIAAEVRRLASSGVWRMNRPPPVRSRTPP